MKNFRTLVRFELKKILGKKLTWIAFGLVLLTTLGMGFYRMVISTEVDGERMTVYESDMLEKEEQKKIAGQTVDDELLEEMFAAFATNETVFAPYTNLYYAVAKAMCGDAIIRGTVDGVKEELGIAENEELIYAVREMRIESGMKNEYLTEAEKNYWREVLAEEDSTPWTYEYCVGPETAWEVAYTAIVLLAIMLAVCLANLFAEEHQKKTDQLVLCSRNGRRVLYWAKLTAGMVFTVVSAGLIILVSVIPPLVIFGAEGLSAPIQLSVPVSMIQMTFGEVMLYSYVLTILAALLYSSIILCCSELFRSSTVAVVAVIGVLVLLPMMVMVPYEYRVLGQIFDLNPINAVAIWSVLDYRLVPFFGGFLTMQQVAPIVYVLLSGVFVFIGRRAYLKYQVGGR